MIAKNIDHHTPKPQASMQQMGNMLALRLFFERSDGHRDGRPTEMLAINVSEKINIYIIDTSLYIPYKVSITAVTPQIDDIQYTVYIFYKISITAVNTPHHVEAAGGRPTSKNWLEAQV